MLRLNLIKLFFLYLFTSIIFLGSCNSEDKICIEDITDSTTTIENLNSCNNAIEDLSFYSKNKPYLIISSEEEYINSIHSTNCTMDIDFSKYNLLIGYFKSDRNVTSFDSKLYKYCTPTEYSLEVTVNKNSIVNTAFYTYNLLVPKKETISKLTITFIQRNN